MIFDPNILKLHRQFAAHNIGDSDFIMEHAADDIMQSLDLLNLQPKIILDIGSYVNNIPNKLSTKYPGVKIIHASEDNLPSETFDLIVSSMNLHWVNEVEKHLRHIHSILTAEGKLITNFALSGSLDNLKKYLIECETDSKVAHSPHIIPLPKEDRVQSIFQQCGFKFVVVSVEKIELEYKNPIDLMRDLKKMGQNNALAGLSAILPKSVIKNAQKIDNFCDVINTVTVVAGK